jgi:hypothetical protein
MLKIIDVHGDEKLCINTNSSFRLKYSFRHFVEKRLH